MHITQELSTTLDSPVADLLAPRTRREESPGTTSLFDGLSKQALGEVSNLTTRLRLPAGSELTTQGRVGRELIIVLEGRVDVIVDGAVRATYGAGHVYGDVALLHGLPSPSTVVASTDVTADVLGRREFATMLAAIPQLATRLQHATVERS